MNQVKNIQNNNEVNHQTQDLNRFEDCEKVVDILVEQGLPKVFNPDNFISKIASNFNLTTQEARTCLKLAISQLETANKPKEKEEEKRYAQSNYFYAQGYNTLSNPKAKQDGMDSLSSLASYNRLMFNLK